MKKSLFLLLIGILFKGNLFSQISFNPDQTTACLPVTINFTNTSSIGSYYNWYFGDGYQGQSMGTGSGISHTYHLPGNLSVVMEAFDNFGNYLGSYSIQLNLEGLPTVLWIADSTICPGDETSIDIGLAQSNDVTWDFGDGTILGNTDYSGVRHVYQSVGTYNVQVTAVTSCGTQTRNSTIYVGNSYPVSTNYNLLIYATPDQVCPGDIVDVSVPYQYSNFYINYGDGTVENGTHQHSYTGANTYPISVTLINGCGNSLTLYDTVEVINNLPLNLPNYNLVYDTTCINSNVEFSSPYYGYSSYLWNFGNGNTATGSNPIHSYPLVGDYPVSLTVTNGCGNNQTIIDTVHISDNVPVTGLTFDGFYATTLCANEGFFMSVEVDGGWDYHTFDWDFGDGETATGIQVQHDYNNTGVYTLSLTATNTCGNSATITEVMTIGNNVIPDPQNYMAGIPEDNPLYCPGDSVLFIFGPGSPDANVQWDFGDGNFGSADKILTVFGVTYNYVKHAYSTLGNYTAELTYTNPCGNSFTKTQNLIISNGVQPNADFFDDPFVYNCENQPVSFIPLGGNTFIWDFGDGSGTLITNSPITPVEHIFPGSGTFNVTMEVINGCGLSEEITNQVFIPESDIEIVTNTIDASCLNANGKAIAVVSGGMAPYEFLWSNGDQTFIADSVTAGIYLVNVTDKNGCKDFAIATVSDAQAPTILTAAVVDVNCHGANNGAIDISVIGNSAPYSFEWSNGSTNEDVNQLEAGPHEVLVTDANGCVATSSIYVSEPGEVIVNMLSENADCGVSNGKAAVAVSGSTGPYNYIWSNQSNNNIITGLAAGIYSVVVIDANGCIFEESVAVSEGDMNIVLDSISGTGCVGDLAGIYIRVLPNGNYSYDWSNGQTSEDITNLSTGIYSVEITDINNSCKAFAQYSIQDIPTTSNEICIVTVDSVSNTNRVVWEKDLNATNISHYNIYKESSQSGVYYLIDQVPYDSMSVWVDPVSNPQVRSWRYKISVVDDCGNESVVSDEHKTIHLTVNEGINNSYNLIWDHYDGLNYSTYEIWRKTNSGGWTLVTTLPSNLNSWTDVTPPAGTEYYRVAAITNANCEPTRAGVNTSRSNVRNTPAAPPFGQNIEENSLNLISIYPNPSTGIFNMELNQSGEFLVDIYNSIGEKLSGEKINNNVALDLSKYSNGIYFIQVKNDNQSKTFKLIKQ